MNKTLADDLNLSLLLTAERQYFAYHGKELSVYRNLYSTEEKINYISKMKYIHKVDESHGSDYSFLVDEDHLDIYEMFLNTLFPDCIVRNLNPCGAWFLNVHLTDN